MSCYQRAEYVKGVFEYLGWTFEEFRERCQNCHKPLAYHGNDEYGHFAIVSCPRCDKGNSPNTFKLPLLPDIPNLEPTGGRPRLALTKDQRDKRRKEQYREAKRRKRLNRAAMSTKTL